MNIGEKNDAKDSFKSLHLLACRWELRETITCVVIYSILEWWSRASKENLDLQTAGVLVNETETRWWWWAVGDTMDNCLLLKLGSVATGSSGCWWRTCPSLSHSATLPGLWTHQLWLEGGGSLRGRHRQRSQNSKLHAQQIWKIPLLLEAVLIWAATTSICGPVDRLEAHQRCFSGAHVDKDFFSKLKKNILSMVMQKAGGSAFPVLRSFTACAHAFLIRICYCICFCPLMVCLCWTPNGISRQTIGDLYPENLQHLFQFRKKGHIVLTGA